MLCASVQKEEIKASLTMIIKKENYHLITLELPSQNVRITVS